ncbi:hypothetical protein GWK47_054219 [Chionoecetes opilio]|uniref:Uncharacterized protein n=1 Tax=Chionoecetes opilio TaxID=41210 RepID=A0A8J4Y014_CHIOP|nr:hypothetical protein GWK47_054219 [Chionoecetes opilio]
MAISGGEGASTLDTAAIDAVLAEIDAFTADFDSGKEQQEFSAAYAGLEQVGSNVGVVSGVQRREKPHPPRIDAHRFSRANLEDSGDVELDTILGELCALETQFEFEISSKGTTTPASSAPSNPPAPRTPASACGLGGQ